MMPHFRAYDIIKRKFYRTIDSLQFEDGKVKEVIFIDDGKTVEWTIKAKVHLMIGLSKLDIHGVEIFEGDVIEYDYDDMHDQNGLRNPHGGKETMVIDIRDVSDIPDLPNDVEIIGHMYEQDNKKIAEATRKESRQELLLKFRSRYVKKYLEEHKSNE